MGERLKALGMRPQEAAQAAQRFSAQLKELGEMGFEDWLTAVELLGKYNGRLLRVANALTEQHSAALPGLKPEPDIALPEGLAAAHSQQAAVDPSASAPSTTSATTPGQASPIQDAVISGSEFAAQLQDSLQAHPACASKTALGSALTNTNFRYQTC